MEKGNARKQTLEQLHERRKEVVRLHKKAIRIMEIVSMTGLYVLDNLRVHRSKIVKVWVAERKDQIELFFLPGHDRKGSVWDAPRGATERRLA